MEFYPSLQTIKEIAASGEYNVAPVSCELFSDFTTPIEVIRILKKVSAHRISHRVSAPDYGRI